MTRMILAATLGSALLLEPAVAGGLVDPRLPAAAELEPLVRTHGHLRMCALARAEDPRSYADLEVLILRDRKVLADRARLEKLRLACRSEPGPAARAAAAALRAGGDGALLDDPAFRGALTRYTAPGGPYERGEAHYARACAHLAAVRAGEARPDAKLAESNPMLWALRHVGMELAIRARAPARTRN